MLTCGVGRLEVFPQTELDDGEGDLARDGNEAAAVQLSERGDIAGWPMVAEGEDILEGEEGGAGEETGLGALLDHLGGDPDDARGDLAEAGGEDVDGRGGDLGGFLLCLGGSGRWAG